MAVFTDAAHESMVEKLKGAGDFMQQLQLALSSPPSFVSSHTPPRSLARDLLTPELVADLRGTVEVLRRDGWLQGAWFGAGGRVCTEGAMIRSISNGRSQEWGDVGGAAEEARFQELREVIYVWLGIPPAIWNDHALQTEENVLAELTELLRAAEAEVPPRPADLAVAPPVRRLTSTRTFAKARVQWLSMHEPSAPMASIPLPEIELEPISPLAELEPVG